MAMPTREQLDEYVNQVEMYVASSFASVTPDIPAISDAIHRLWLDLSRFGPPELPELRIPGLGAFEVPAPPPPPPPPPVPRSWIGDVGDWAGRNRRLVGGICVCALGAGLLAGYSASRYAHKRRIRLAKSTTGSAGAANFRKLVVVVLGGDTPLGPPLVAGLEQEGYIVIASVSTPDAVAELEAISSGYVKALVLNPQEPSTIPYFLRSLQATLTLRFPLNTSGDPYQHSPLSTPHLHAVISLLTLPSPSLPFASNSSVSSLDSPASAPSPPPSPLEHLPLPTKYVSYLLASHVVPLQAVQALLPLFRVQTRAHGERRWHRTSKSIIFCVPATDARVGIPFAGAQAMSAAATVRGAEVLRRELAQVAHSQHPSHPMQDLRVVVVDIGSIGDRSSDLSLEADDSEEGRAAATATAERAMERWTSGERAVYGPAYVSHITRPAEHGRRRPTSVPHFVDALVTAVGRNAGGHGEGFGISAVAVGLRLWWFGLRRTLKGDRFAVGAGARTYALASYLPTSVLDALLALPSFLASVRNRYLLQSPRMSGPIVPPIPPEAAVSRSVTEPPTTASVHLAEQPDLEAGSTAELAVSPVDARLSDVTLPLPSPTGPDEIAPANTPEFDSSASMSGVESSWISVQDQ